MTGTLRSLRDWLADQVAEVRHLSPLAVLAPAKSTPVAVPALEDMPSTESEPCCWAGRLVRPVEPPCDQPAEWVVRTSHTPADTSRRRQCDPPGHMLLCDHHLNHLRDHVAVQIPSRCVPCGTNIDRVSDVVRWTVRL